MFLKNHNFSPLSQFTDFKPPSELLHLILLCRRLHEELQRSRSFEENLKNLKSIQEELERETLCMKTTTSMTLQEMLVAQQVHSGVFISKRRKNVTHLVLNSRLFVRNRPRDTSAAAVRADRLNVLSIELNWKTTGSLNLFPQLHFKLIWLPYFLDFKSLRSIRSSSEKSIIEKKKTIYKSFLWEGSAGLLSKNPPSMAECCVNTEHDSCVTFLCLFSNSLLDVSPKIFPQTRRSCHVLEKFYSQIFSVIAT